MIRSLPLLHRIAGTKVVVIGVGEGGAARRRLVERAGGVVCGEAEAHQARLAFIADCEPGAAAQKARKLKGLGLLVNVADQPDLCDFTVPSIIDRDPVLIAVATSGASAGLAKHLRLRIEALLPQNLGALALGLEAARAKLRQILPGNAERRAALDSALAEGGALDVMSENSAAKVDDWLAGIEAGAESMPTVRNVTYHITSDDADDLTLRQARDLGVADVVIYDPQISPDILARSRADAARIILSDPESPLPAELAKSGLIIKLRRATL